MAEPSACPACGREAPVPGAAFCPYCGAPLAPHAPTDERARALVDEAQRQRDPQKKHELLLAARERFPDCLPVEEQLLYLGRLYERSPKKLDFSVIKCHLLKMYLAPGEFADGERDAMRRELFDHPQLQRCLALAPDADAFLRGYLERLSREFIVIFLRGDNRYMQSLFGIRMDSRAPKLLAAPVCDMLLRVRADTALEADRRALLRAALYAAFSKEMGGETSWLDAALAAKGVKEG